jgi:2,3-diketo-5-methylthio-1-phosphopentane phosphatase
MSRRPLHVFSDFDGTITVPDTLEFLVARFGGGMDRYRELGTLLRSGAITLREGVAREVGSVTVPFEEAAAALRTGVRIDPGFPGFARWCAEHRIPLTILSAGFTEIIELLLPPEVRAGVEVRANRLVPGSWRCVFRDESPYGHDKAAAVEAARRAGHRTVFVGDGFSDREPARAADLVLARRGRSLIDWCREQRIACGEFETFADVQRRLAAHVQTAA